MSNVIENNAYRILGLDNGVNQKDALKRYKEIINRLKIDDYPEYDLDLNLPKDLRTEESINDALKRLQNVKNNVVENFFWFQIRDTIDESALNDLRDGKYDHAILTWKDASETENSMGLFYKKNLTLLYCFTLLKEENDEYLKESIQNWNEIINSDKFWESFEKIYGINNDQSTNTELINEFRNNVKKHISDIYTDLYQQHKNPKYIKKFQEIIGIHGEKIEKILLKPLHQSIYDTIEELKKINFEKKLDSHEKGTSQTEIKCDVCGKSSLDNQFSEKFTTYDDGSILCKECHKTMGKEWKRKIDEQETVEGSTKIFRLIQKSINKLELQLEQLNQIGLYNDAQSKVVRDHAAEAIRNASIMIHNDAHMVTESIDLLNLAKKISGTESVKEKMEFDINDIKEIKQLHTENTLLIENREFFRKQNIVINAIFLEYKKSKIYFKDVIKISYYSDNDKFFFNIASSDDTIFLKLFDREIFGKVIDYASQFIEPIIVDNLVKSIFEKDQSVSIGKVIFDKRGYHQSKMLRGMESVLWGDSVYPAEFSQGFAVLFKKKDNMIKQFASVELKNPNAPIIPELVKACFNEYHMRNQS